jgi:hypothetical protein
MYIHAAYFYSVRFRRRFLCPSRRTTTNHQQHFNLETLNFIHKVIHYMLYFFLGQSIGTGPSVRLASRLSAAGPSFKAIDLFVENSNIVRRVRWLSAFLVGGCSRCVIGRAYSAEPIHKHLRYKRHHLFKIFNRNGFIMFCASCGFAYEFVFPDLVAEHAGKVRTFENNMKKRS